MVETLFVYCQSPIIDWVCYFRHDIYILYIHIIYSMVSLTFDAWEYLHL